MCPPEIFNPIASGLILFYDTSISASYGGSVSYTVPNVGFFGENPASATNFSLFNSIAYYQRVYSSGLSQWCYYLTIGTINTSPASTATSPNWTGTTSNHQIVTIKYVT